MESAFSSIEEYIAGFPDNIQKKLDELRTVIKASAPEAEEKISYQIPTFFLKGNLVQVTVICKMTVTLALVLQQL